MHRAGGPKALPKAGGGDQGPDSVDSDRNQAQRRRQKAGAVGRCSASGPQQLPASTTGAAGKSTSDSPIVSVRTRTPQRARRPSLQWERPDLRGASDRRARTRSTAYRSGPAHSINHRSARTRQALSAGSSPCAASVCAQLGEVDPVFVTVTLLVFVTAATPTDVVAAHHASAIRRRLLLEEFFQCDHRCLFSFRTTPDQGRCFGCVFVVSTRALPRQDQPSRQTVRPRATGHYRC